MAQRGEPQLGVYRVAQAKGNRKIKRAFAFMPMDGLRVGDRLVYWAVHKPVKFSAALRLSFCVEVREVGRVGGRLMVNGE